MELLLIRHAEPVRVVSADGPADPPLRDRGRRQAQRLAEWLAGEDLDAIVSSPLRRARETAELVAQAQAEAHAQAHDLEVVIDDDLAEFDREATSYIPYEELKASRDPRFMAMAEGRLEEYQVDPESFQTGVVTAIERIVKGNPSRKVAVVCHGGVINAYTAHVAGIDRLLWFETQYASITRVAASSRGPRSIFTLNETPHLRGTGLLQ